MPGAWRSIEARLSDSFLLRRGRHLWAKNQQDWNHPLSFSDKFLVTAYLVLRDHAAGSFPPTFHDQRQAYENEIAFRDVLPGMDTAAVIDAELRKPFWPGKLGRKYLEDYAFFTSLLERSGLEPGASLLELGCGSGWMAEFLATTGYRVTATTLAPEEIEDCKKRLGGLTVRGVEVQLEYLASPMESIHESIAASQSPAAETDGGFAERSDGKFDGAYVYEALHHAYSWEDTIKSVSACLKNGAWLMICNEPNRLHTIRSYRGALLSNTHEIGFRKSALVDCLKENGFRGIRVVRGKIGFYTRPFWMVARLEK